MDDQIRKGWKWQIWWTIAYLGIYQTNWWLKRKYFGTEHGIHDTELWKAIKTNPLKIINTLK